MTITGTTSAVTFESRFIIGQDATVSMRVTADEVTFIGSVDHGGSSFDIEGTVTTLSFPGNLQIASGSTASVVSSSENSVRVALGTIWYAIDRKSSLCPLSYRYRVVSSRSAVGLFISIILVLLLLLFVSIFSVFQPGSINFVSVGSATRRNRCRHPFRHSRWDTPRRPVG